MSSAFQYFSDVHTEQYKSADRAKFENEIIPMAPYLILAGDIGDPSSQEYIDFLSMLSPKYKYIFLISGNHEYYGRGIDETHELIRNRLLHPPLPNIIYLQNEVFHIPGTDITVFGATFWSYIKPEEETSVKTFIMDYRRIPNFTIEKSRELHINSRQALKNALDAFPDKKFVVISHHLPSFSLVNPKYLNTPLNSAYATDIEEANHPNIKAWVAGHTHTRVQLKKVYVNPIGYPNENAKRYFNICFFVH
jgi:DNA repair exonuclease SbcCD nuclease subunit